MIKIPQKPAYGFAYFIVVLMHFIAVVIFFIGILLVIPALNENNNIFQYGYATYGFG